MYGYNDIAIIGDSWCAQRTKDIHWPKILANKLISKSLFKVIPRGWGFKGCSWWSARNCLLDELRQTPIKVLILCHTEPNRIPSDDDIGLNYWSVLDNRNKTEVFDAAVRYFEHLHFTEYHKWCQIRWFDELDSIIEANKIEKVIHLHCFPDSFFKNSKSTIATYKFKTGVTIEDSLYNYRDKTLNDKKFPNHLTIEQNNQLALVLYDIIQKYPGNGVFYGKKLL